MVTASPAQEIAAGVFAGVAVRTVGNVALIMCWEVRRVTIQSMHDRGQTSHTACIRAYTCVSQDARACHPVDVIKTQFHVNKGQNGSMLQQLRQQGAAIRAKLMHAVFLVAQGAVLTFHAPHALPTAYARSCPRRRHAPLPRRSARVPAAPGACLATEGHAFIPVMKEMSSQWYDQMESGVLMRPGSLRRRSACTLATSGARCGAARSAPPHSPALFDCRGLEGAPSHRVSSASFIVGIHRKSPYHRYQSPALRAAPAAARRRCCAAAAAPPRLLAGPGKIITPL